MMIIIAKTYISLIIPVLIIFLFILLAYILPFFLKRIKKKREKRKIKNLKKQNNKLIIKLSDCEVLTGNFFSEKMKHGYSPVFRIFENKYQEEFLKTNSQEKEISILYYEGVYNGEKKKFYSEILKISPQSLYFIFEKYKHTYLYIDNNNPENYCFNLDFLKDFQ